MERKYSRIYCLLLGLFLLGVSGVQAADIHNTVRTFLLPDGRFVDVVIVPGHPPEQLQASVTLPRAPLVPGTNILSDVPAFDWCYGCSATSAAMMAGYYDRTGFPNSYAGPANGGVCPLDNSTWGSGESPLAATHQGYDGLLSRGFVDDYWISYGSSADDPYITNGWVEHSWSDCTGDFMMTSQSAFGNTDGSTTFYYYTSGAPYSGDGSNSDGGYGLRHFFESRGYTVAGEFNQYIEGYGGNSQGFSFLQFVQEIDSGRPVLIQLDGHTVLGFGYDFPSSTIYIHDTWDHLDHSMTWGGSYGGMDHIGVTVIQLEPNPELIFSDGFETGDTSNWSSGK